MLCTGDHLRDDTIVISNLLQNVDGDVRKAGEYLRELLMITPECDQPLVVWRRVGVVDAVRASETRQIFKTPVGPDHVDEVAHDPRNRLCIAHTIFLAVLP